jgi:3-methylfumaryl-CoA hydratase
LSRAVGRVVTLSELITAAPVASLQAAFGHDAPALQPGDELPPLWHGLFCNAKLPPSRLGGDGLGKDEGLLPAAQDYPNKLFGGARFDFKLPLRIGDQISKESEVMSFKLKEGRSGPFIVGLIEHRIMNHIGVAVVEQNDIIFKPVSVANSTARNSSSQSAETKLPATARTRTIKPDPILMFRHSAVTFNSHRIHYDRDYAREKGYPGLLVQGTLIARLMLDILAKDLPAFDVAAFSFRSGQPIYDDGDFMISASLDAVGTGVSFLALDHDGRTGMIAEASHRSK